VYKTMFYLLTGRGKGRGNAVIYTIP